ncbi:PepSY domain-containing protein [uncultured Amnibacterium sp.]|uniref:PepSY domain-containing protein n=1 Tax=uncultured Amnibacterium sp. TaxID=1631851 RepID=UPI0035CCA7EA
MRRPARILTLAAAAPLTVLALAACTQPVALPAIPSASATAVPTPTATPGPSVAAIAALAVREVGEGTVVSVEDESAGTEWDVRVVLSDGTVQEVHLARDGTVLAGPSADSTDANAESANRAQVAAASVALDAAQRRMLAAVPGGRVTGIELDDYEDRVVWQGDVLDPEGVRHDVRIDAVNGSVLLDRADAERTPATGS